MAGSLLIALSISVRSGAAVVYARSPATLITGASGADLSTDMLSGGVSGLRPWDSNDHAFRGWRAGRGARIVTTVGLARRSGGRRCPADRRPGGGIGGRA
ncbi:hypothetical protein GCM10029963_15650 [Micromonospora andamanensis]|nr:hypothetical protein Vwe01_29500 [Micromonospora andamanensis]